MKVEWQHEGLTLPAGMHPEALLSDACSVEYRLATQQLQKLQVLN